VIGAMYFRPSHAAAQPTQREAGPILAMVLCIAAVIGVGLLPGRFLEIAVHGGQSILQPAPAPAAQHLDDSPKIGSEPPSAQASPADRAG
jgi:hypothetical protein